MPRQELFSQTKLIIGREKLITGRQSTPIRQIYWFSDVKYHRLKDQFFDENLRGCPCRNLSLSFDLSSRVDMRCTAQLRLHLCIPFSIRTMKEPFSFSSCFSHEESTALKNPHHLPVLQSRCQSGCQRTRVQQLQKLTPHFLLVSIYNIQRIRSAIIIGNSTALSTCNICLVPLIEIL